MQGSCSLIGDGSIVNLVRHLIGIDVVEDRIDFSDLFDILGSLLVLLGHDSVDLEVVLLLVRVDPAEDAVQLLVLQESVDLVDLPSLLLDLFVELIELA